MAIKLLKIAALVVVNLAITTVLLEVVLRVIPLPAGYATYLKIVGMLKEQEDAYTYDPRTSLPVMRPNKTFTWSIMDGEWTVSTVPYLDDDRLGLRDDGLDPQASYRIMACGDSFTFGFGVDNEDVWHEILETAYDGEIDIFNVRAVGSSVADINDTYALFADRIQHDEVFLGIYLGNEFQDNYFRRGLSASTPSTTEAGASGSGNWTIFGLLREYSYSARLVKYLFFRQWIRIGYYNYETKRQVYQPPESPFAFTIDYEENILVRTCEKDYTETMERGVTIFREELSRFVDKVRSEGKELRVFIFPFKEQVYWEQWIHMVPDPDQYERFKPNRIVVQALRELDVVYYDLTQDLIAAGQTQILYWPIDSHWNPQGNRVAARLIYDWLASQRSAWP